MVLINNLTIDEINAALLHLQRSSGEIVGGDKGRTVNNISVSNSGGGGMDYQSVINFLKERLSQVETTNTEQQTQINEILLTLGNLADNGIQDFDYDENSGELTITTKDGEEYTVVIRSPTSTLTFDATTKKLTFTFNDDITEITLPYVASSEKGVANGVATLDSTGRVPYSQLPESAMEFKGEWNANTNTPHLQDGTGDNGDFYVCTEGGTVNFGTGGVTRNITFYPNDRVIYEGTSQQWFRLPAGEVRTVNGQSGDVVLDGEDINYSSASGSPTIKEQIDTVEGYAKTQSDWGQTNTSAIDYIKNKPSLATVATSGSYNDLSNKPTIPAAQIQSDWTQTDSTKKDFIKNKIPIWITTGSADDNMSPIDSVTDGSMRPITSNAVFDAIVGQSGTSAEITIGEVAWIKVCSIENWDRGDVLELYFQNNWNTAGSSARKITIAKGTMGSGGNFASWVNVTEEASDPQTLLSEIQICGANSTSSTDKVFVYVKYNKTTSNTIRMAYKSVGFLPPTIYMTKETPSGYALNVNYALHDKGFYVNGVNISPIDSVTVNNMQSVTSNAVYNEIKTRLLAIWTTGKTISDGATSMTDAEFFTKVMQKTGTPIFLYFGYAWGSDCLISFYEGSTLKGKINANGNSMMLVQGSFGVGSWNALTYVVFGGFNNTGTKNNAIVIGSLTYNGGSTLERHCNFM